jgi:dTDP-4-amino-4,6-dideoxygalactose transaminase
MTEQLAVEGGTPVRASFLPFGMPAIGDEEIEEVVAVLRSGWIGQGARVAQFEREFCAAIGAAEAVAVSSCTAAIHLSLLLAGVKPGDEVLVPDLTFVATATAVEHAGAIPVFCDVDARTLNVDLADCARRVTDRTSAVVPVHFGGLPCDVDAIVRWSQQHGLRVIEDAAHGLGAALDGRPVGSRPETLSCFSFYANKNITTGEGGMIALDAGDDAERLRQMRLHGLSADAWRRFQDRTLRTNSLEVLGFKYNLTDLQAALGIRQLQKLERFQRRREQIAARYDDVLGTIPGLAFQARSFDDHHVRHSFHLYLVLLENGAFAVPRDQIVSALRAENIGAAIHYRALHLEPYYVRRFGHREDEFPSAAWASERILTLPLSPAMSDRDVDDVLVATRKVLGRYCTT